jgi:hypothetical protein
MSSSRTIPQIEAEIQAIKNANLDWLSNPAVMALITALENRINALAPAGKVITKSLSILFNKLRT